MNDGAILRKVDKDVIRSNSHTMEKSRLDSPPYVVWRCCSFKGFMRNLCYTSEDFYIFDNFKLKMTDLSWFIVQIVKPDELLNEIHSVESIVTYLQGL